MEIKAGEYVRTKDGLIDKVQNYSYSQNIWHCENGMCIDECNCIGTHLKDIANHNFNIKELIEEGDIVEYQVNSLSKLKVGRVNSYRDTRSNKECLCVEGFDITKIAKIRTILTHEQYEKNCYRLENN